MYTLVYPPESPCGCGSTKPFGKCCLKNGTITLMPKRGEPAPPGTRYRNRKCILGWTNNCCTKISGDHIVSASVLRVLSHEKIKISAQGVTREHSIRSSALTVKKLCRRHNSAFSVIDAEAARLFKSFVSINGHLTAGTEGQKLYFFHGTDIEHWLLKTMLMVFYSKHSNVVPGRFKLSRHGMMPFRYELHPPLGLYIPTKTDANNITSFRTEPAATVALITRNESVSGVNVTLGGLPLTLLVDGYESDFTSLRETHTYRPTNLLFFRQTQVYAITLVFGREAKRDVWFSHGDPVAMIPAN